MMIDGYVAEILNNQIMNEINAKKATDKEKLIEKDIKSIENRVRHAFNQGYEAGLKHGKEQEPKIDMESEEIKFLQKRAYLEGFHEALKMSVKQEPLTDVLDKIRAEIDFIADSNGVKHIHRDDVHRIIDKYKERIKCHNKNCTDCILDLTDACSRGAGRAVDDEICEDFLEADKENEE